ncbi:MAG: dihydrofolate reductase [Spirochaetaceae bacterium]|nr:dihydrofolate reductase [Spirochaetaceae bacterium]
MILSIIVAMGNNRQIGKDNKLLWHISDDLKNFKKLTLGHHILMGRKTYESIGRPLPGRTTIIMSRNPEYSARGCKVVSSFEEAATIAEAAGDNELFICGGEKIYKNLLAQTDRFYLSYVDYDGQADAFFPQFSIKDLKLIEEVRHEKTDKAPKWVYKVLER